MINILLVPRMMKIVNQIVTTRDIKMASRPRWLLYFDNRVQQLFTVEVDRGVKIYQLLPALISIIHSCSSHPPSTMFLTFSTRRQRHALVFFIDKDEFLVLKTEQIEDHNMLTDTSIIAMLPYAKERNFVVTAERARVLRIGCKLVLLHQKIKWYFLKL